MKVIDLLNKIANGEEVPKQIKARGVIWEFDKKYNDYHNDEEWFFISGFDEFKNSKEFLELKVEIIEEEKEIEEIQFDEIDELTDYDIYFFPECEDDSKENFKNKINELIRNQKKIIKAVNELKKGK